MKQVEGRWDEVIQHADQFVGRRVRVTVLSDEKTAVRSRTEEIRRWFAEGDALEPMPSPTTKPDPFGDALVEKFRGQGLVL